MEIPPTKQIQLSIVLPCLNEEANLARCINEVVSAMESNGLVSYEIIVADNGSTDRSAEIALQLGARVIFVPEPGYGRALSHGIRAAVSSYVVFADADGTYPLAMVPELYLRTVETGAVVGLASRLRGRIEPGAMPWLHRWVGTPFFTILINLLYRGRITDCGSGFRCVRREWFLSSLHHATGMEFASENLIRAYKSKARVVEISGGLRRVDHRRQPHLRTWRDGMRHLMFILSESPALFERCGLSACIGASLLQLAATWHGPLEIGVVDIFGLHTQGLALLAAILGSQLYFMGVLLHERAEDEPLRFTNALLRLSEDRLFFSLLGACGLGLCVVAAMAFVWWQRHFSGLSVERLLLGAVHLTLLLGSFSLGFFGAHITRTWRTPAPVANAVPPTDRESI